MIFTEITFKSWAAGQTSEIGAALAANGGRPVTWTIEAGLVLFHAAWPAMLARRLCIEGLPSVVLDSADARAIQLRVAPPWPANGGARGPRSLGHPRTSRPRTSRSAIPGYQPRRRGAGGLASRDR